MRTEAESAQRDYVAKLETNQVDFLTDGQKKYVDVEEQTSSTMANQDDEMMWSVVDSTLVSSDVQKSHVEGKDVGGVNCRATEDSEEDSDSTSTSDELASDMQNLRLLAGSVDQCIEPLVSRGPPGGATSTARWNNERQSSMHFAWPTSVEPDETAPSDVRCKRKGTCEPPTISLQPQPLRVADTFSEVFQLGTGCQGWTGWSTQQHEQQATKFRRSGNDPQENDERTPKTSDSRTISTISAEIIDAESGLLFDPDAECDLAEYWCPEIEPAPFPELNGHDCAPPSMQSQTDSLGTDKLSLYRGTLLDQLNEIGPPPTNCVVDPNAELALQRCYGDPSHVVDGSMLMPSMTTTVICGSDTMTYPSTRTDTTSNCSAAMKPHDGCVFLRCSELELSPRPAFTAPSPSVDSGCFVAASPTTSSADPFTLVVPPHDLPPDVIFDYVEDKLRELVRYVFMSVFFIKSLYSDDLHFLG